MWLPASSRSILCGLAPSDPIMDETNPTSAATSTNRDRLAGIIWSATKGRALLLAIAMLLASAPGILGVSISLVRGEPVGMTERDIVALTLVLAVAFLVLFAFMVVLPALTEWSGIDSRFRRWAGRRAEEGHWKRLQALGEAHKALFHFEQRCKLSPAEEVWVRRARSPQSNQLLLEVLHTRDSGRTWERLPLRLSPWARFKRIMLEGEWPPNSTRHISRNEDGISFESLVLPDHWEGAPSVWRATYRPRWRWWTLKVVGPPWPGKYFAGTGGPPSDSSRPRNA